MTILRFFAFGLIVLWGGRLLAQELSDAELAKKAQNPIASMISLPIQHNMNFGLGPYERTQHVTNIQPVYPVSLGNWNLVNRVIAPFIYQPDIQAESGGTFGLGDVVYEGFFTPASNGKVTWGLGPVLILPTATDPALGSGKFSAGPALVLVAAVNKWVLGAVGYNAWSLLGKSERPDYNAGMVQYFINYNLPKAWYLTSAPSITVNWKAPENNKWIVPFGAGGGKIFAIGKQKINANVSAYWNLVKPEIGEGPDWTLRAMLVFLFPK